MNKFETHHYSRSKPIRVIERLSDTEINSLTWISTEDLIKNPLAYPIQEGLGWGPEDRVRWAKSELAQGRIFIVSWPFGDDDGFRLAACKGVPAREYRHVSKIWREVK
jgi:hypothetical protein